MKTQPNAFFEPIDPIDRTEAMLPIEPMLAIDPALPIDAMLPAEPIDAMLPAEPMLAIDPALPNEKMLPAEPIDAFDRTDVRSVSDVPDPGSSDSDEPEPATTWSLRSPVTILSLPLARVPRSR
ncbi:hypothetical protein [Cryptosporangium aurantiacum]|uniref:Uncharacterized protein n=1 Tax=Cryptosporangium aurantiacum TaxID=134849 RepID=A0A1M7QLX2_9ACTN|nr:hypothetical protein [Cryptosporangium aurantiacum]SHN32262.1 hypothetical protein SAMN05443668_10515 [Cryptosporangium aurantiacum]